MANKDLEKLLKQLEDQNFRIIEKRNGLFALSPDKTKNPVSIHRTPSDYRAWNNMLAEQKRAGFIRNRK